MESVGGNIISSLGAGSGINSNSIVEQLSDIERSFKQEQIDTKRESFKAQISDFGLIRSALGTLQEQADLLSDSATFNSKSASFTDSDAFIPVSLAEETPTGTYSFEVIDVAQAQSLSTSASFSDPTADIGKGSITINFGQWDTAEPPTTFTANDEKDALVIDIDEGNNSLNGLRDAINDADVGINASIVNDGSGYRLLLTAESGLSNQLSISATEEAGAPGLADFNFDETTQSLTQAQAGKDSQLKVNGLLVTRSTNQIDDVLDGFEFTLAKADPGTVVNVTISEDKSGGQQAVRDFVDSYNAFLEAIEPAVGYDSENEEDGSLVRDPTAKSLQRQLRAQIASAIGGLEEGFTSLTNVGVRTELDGTLSIDEDDFSRAFDDNYDLVKSLFSPQTDSTNDRIQVTGYRDTTVPGNYDVNITQDPSKGELVGGTSAGSLLTDLAAANTSGSFTAAASAFTGTDLATQGYVDGDYSFDISVDGGDAVTITLPIADYADENAIATALQTQFDDNGIEADITYSGSEFVITSRSAGTNSAIAISNVVEPVSGELGLDAGSATAGTGPNTDDYSFTAKINGITSDTISIQLGSYADEDELAAHIQTQINNDAKLKAAGADVDVVWNGDHFEITSRDYGEKSTVNITGLGSAIDDTGLTTGTSTAGKDVKGTFNGVAGFGVGDVLLPKLDSDPYGLSLQVKPGAASGSVSFSKGFGLELSELIDSYLERNGILSNREDSLNDRLDGLDDDQDKLDRRMEAYTARLMAQFQAMETIINSLNSSGSALDNIADRLPFTASSG